MNDDPAGLWRPAGPQRPLGACLWARALRGRRPRPAPSPWAPCPSCSTRAPLGRPTATRTRPPSRARPSGALGACDYPFEPAFIQKRNERERQPSAGTPEGYARLRGHLPGALAEKRLSKVEMLRAAIRHIRHLQELLSAAPDGAAPREPRAAPSLAPGSAGASCGESEECSHSSRLRPPGLGGPWVPGSLPTDATGPLHPSCASATPARPRPPALTADDYRARERPSEPGPAWPHPAEQV